MTIRIDESAANRLVNSTERMAQAGREHDYQVGLDVFHQLHCLVKLCCIKAKDDIEKGIASYMVAEYAETVNLHTALQLVHCSR